ncbi:MAG: hypothetical protein A2Z91_06130 [Deltaproteobacteria bacterium GWA2_38_16]|nr:MAG: hypothetical protein A2Z91_06130 [Deltaproteobacteria bacterium GWA2_38_16]OGQ03736.1 MAG: hypothetical protein A3D19_02680 [Deltaproteobacteria bacterium RIFCSPHIGHO2_02_FULL_38_15]
MLIFRYNCYTIIIVRFKFDKNKSKWLRKRRGIGFEEAQEIWMHPYYLDQRDDCPEQWRAIGWVKGKLYSVIYEEKEKMMKETITIL